jgi:hypothetical protein
MSEMPRQNPLGLSVYTSKNEGQVIKTGLFQGWVPLRVDGHKESMNEGEYGG